MTGSLLFWQCQRTTYTKSNFPDERLNFGSGGGFTGAVTSYHLLPNGQLFKSEGLQPDTTLHSTILEGEAKTFFKKAEEAKLLGMDFNHPGNMYHFIGYYTKEGENQVTWGGNDVELPILIEELYTSLHDLIAEEPSK